MTIWAERLTRMFLLCSFSWIIGYADGIFTGITAKDEVSKVKVLTESHDIVMTVGLLTLAVLVVWGYFFVHRIARWLDNREARSSD